MVSTTFDARLIELIQFFENYTKAKVKDAFFDTNEKLTFVVEKGEIGKAVGKSASILKKVEEKMGRRIRVAEYTEDKLALIRSLVAPLALVRISEDENGVVYMEGKDEKTTGLLIGKQARNLRNLEWMVRRYMPVEEIRVEEQPEGAQALKSEENSQSTD
ncbi:MAG: NusA-like transcription termination signal-binding factor [Candidatus Woesearchaeota archaeon]